MDAQKTAEDELRGTQGNYSCDYGVQCAHNGRCVENSRNAAPKYLLNVLIINALYLRERGADRVPYLHTILLARADVQLSDLHEILRRAAHRSRSELPSNVICQQKSTFHLT